MRRLLPKLALFTASAVVPLGLAGCYSTTEPQVAPTGATEMVAPTDPNAVGVAVAPVVVAVAAPAPVAMPVAAPGPTLSGGAAAMMIAIQPPTPQPMAPPPLRQAPAMVALPNLPHPSSYPHLPTTLAAADVTECGITWTGSDWMPMECVDPGVLTGQARTARVVIPYTLMPQPAAGIPALVDHRVEGMEGPVRHQGGPQCTAFALTAALDHAYARWTGKPGAFSVMQVWARYHKSSEDQAADGNVGTRLGSEADWPYDSPLASSWKACHGDPSTWKPGTRCGETPDAQKVRELEMSSIAEITQIEVIPRGRLDVVREKLAAGQDVVAGVRLHSYATAGDPGSKYIIGDERNKPKKGGQQHQILLAGYAMTANGNYYLVHNSAGTKWGDDGYGWLHEDVLRAYSLTTDLVVPEVQPRQVAALRFRPDGGLNAKCEAGSAPDSISGMCAVLCPDGSPRHNDVCADAASHCPPGTLNLTGACLMAAPRSAGLDPASHVGWTCGPGGCTYDVPRGVLACKEAACAVSCPAPSFRLATTPNGLACVE